MCDRCRDLELQLSQASDELVGTLSKLRGANSQIGRLQRELRDAYGEGEDANVVIDLMLFFKKESGRTRMRVSLDTEGAQRIRWARRHWTDREIGVAIRGLCRDEYWSRKGRKPQLVQHLLKNEETFERALENGLRMGYRTEVAA